VSDPSQKFAVLEAALARSESARRLAEERLRRLVDPMPDATFYVDPARRFVDGNPRFLASYKAVYGIELVPGISALAGLPERVAALWALHYDVAFRGTENSFLFHETIGGKTHTFDIRLVPNVVDGVVEGVTVVSRDVSALYDLKQDLEQTKQEITAVLESSSDAIWSVDSQLRIRTLNARFIEETFEAVGVRPRIGMSVPEILGERFCRVAPFYERALSGEAFGFEFSYPIPRDGGLPEIRHLEVQMLPLRDTTNQSIIGVTVFNKDVTQKRLLLAQLMELDRLVAIGTLAAGVGHEINNPLAFVLTNLELLRETFEAFREAPPRGDALDDGLVMLADAEDGARRIRDIVRELRLLSRAEDPKANTILDVRGPLERALALAGHELRQHAEIIRDYPTDPSVLTGAEGDLDGPADGAPRVRGSDGRLTQVFLNLLINAAHAFPPGRRGTVRLRITYEGDRIIVEVTDDGSGIPEEILPRIFDAFFTTKPRGEGTGLGLSIARRILLEHGGDLTIVSQQNAGTTALVVLPALPTT
jgi:signal transduction histidine kinase